MRQFTSGHTIVVIIVNAQIVEMKVGVMAPERLGAPNTTKLVITPPSYNVLKAYPYQRGGERHSSCDARATTRNPTETWNWVPNILILVVENGGEWGAAVAMQARIKGPQEMVPFQRSL